MPQALDSKTETETFEEKLQRVVDRLKESGPKLLLEGLPPAARAQVLSQLSRKLSRPILVVSANPLAGESLLGDIQYFARREKIKQEPRFFPSWELLPYEPLSPLCEISGERLEILDQLTTGKIPLLIAPVEALMQRVISMETLGKLTFPIKIGDSVEREFLETCLIDNGYTHASLVEERGEFSLRGDILDVFLPSHAHPVRIEFFGDQVESIRVFDSASQASIKEIQETKILPVRELCLSDSEKEQGLKNIREFARQHGTEVHAFKELSDKLQWLGNFSGMEMLAPFFYPDMKTLLDYLPAETLIVLDEEEVLLSNIQDFENLVQTEYEHSLDEQNAVPEPERLYTPRDELLKRLDASAKIGFNTLRTSPEDLPHVVQFDVKNSPMFQGRFEAFAEQAMEWKEAGNAITVAAPSRSQVKRARELLDNYGVEVGVELGRISSGFSIDGRSEVFVAEHEIFGRSQKQKRRKKPKSQSFQRGFKDLKKGDFLVHIDYGIGRYEGMRELTTGVGGGEFLEISFAEGEKLYIPMDGLAHIQKYIGSNEAPPPLNKLGSVSWKRQKQKIKESIRLMAEGLLKLYASRETAEGHSYPANPIMTQAFSDSFEFEETEDQNRAIEEIFEDLEKDKPMDRLVCGDVGYGKTEVAMRAAFRVVQEKKQVAVLVPTTVLAQQHLNTFRERFKAYPVNIDMVNRFRSPSEQKKTLAKLKSGELDVIIGTHRLLSKDVEFANIGLVVVDEEQRFGVRHKEKLKEFRLSADVLTLTATPIPRTLHFSLMGVRDLSVIETPPVDRLAIKTYVRKFEEHLIQEAILREHKRGGQIYFVHNKVRSIHSVAEKLKKIAPDIRIGVAHGQLPEHQLERVMTQFVNREIDLLLCTTIVESGLDIPSANTIIINRADQFGLAQLYQLRGRVGRSRVQAYAYLLIPGAMAISTEARKRLAAIEEMSELGSGFQLAARDMEIRGTGNMLGHNQSGHINTIGFDMYTKMMEETVKELKGKKVESIFEPEIDLEVKGYIPKTYVPDLNQRLEAYRRIQLVDLEYLEPLAEEWSDRFGTPPDPAEKLIALVRVKLLCQKLHISKMLLRRNTALMTIAGGSPLSSAKLAGMLDDQLKLVSEYQLGLALKREGWRKDLDVVIFYLVRLLNEACHDPMEE